MIREDERIKSSMFGIYTMILTVGTYIASFRIAHGIFNLHLVYSTEYLALLLLLLPIWFFGLSRTALLKIYQVNHYLLLFKQSVMFILIGVGILFALINLFNLTNISKEVIITFAIINQLSIYLSYIIANQYYMGQRKKGHNLTNIILIVGEENIGFIKKIIEHKEWGYNVVMLISDSQKVFAAFGNILPVKNESSNIPEIIKSEIVDEVLYCKNKFSDEDILSIMHVCEEVGVSFRLYSNLFSFTTAKAELFHFDGVPFITYRNTPSNQYALSWKYILDFVISCTVVILWMPLLLIIAFLIKATSKGPIVFKQKRVGLHGREFYIYKFRTMMQDAESMQMKIMDQNEMSGPVFKIKNDPRITRIGKYLRKTSLDELPQFFNVIKGDMSLVGPRPPIMSEVKQYKPWQLRRLSMRPGITCIWQTMPRRNSISFEDWMKMDLQYIDNWSLEKDLILTVKTIRTVLMGSGQ